MTISGLSGWAIIAIAHLGFRRTLRQAGGAVPAFHLPGAPWTTLLILAATVGVAISMGFRSDTRVGLYTGAVWAALIVIAYTVKKRRRPVVDTPDQLPILARTDAV